MKKAQGLPLNAIVLGILALLVLVVVGAAWIVGGGNIFRGFSQIIRGQTPGTLTQAQASCQQLCTNIKTGVVPNIESIPRTDYCTKTFDLSQQNPSYAVNEHCYGSESGLVDSRNSPVTTEVLDIPCTITLTNGSSVILDATCCTGGACTVI
ncbi:MAG: hypothetical protein OH319_01555 [Candidatus Parvarchaeota archaeon]|nr:hypothetical protein [Candidatus Jingweiarchaeum tengchongense]MCW1297743.1 hypothetical protein [Candidatus Jingweiarchaeum tengchongense]MCW1299753.1 hypothetical protein [Candidatus Jingweiarchaeum tengchongense]MCW1304276.1 hypothetical protein [Candidatus Jingweiarchaeum tengchongense]MCW1305304.1 hypothetical protein [Candidatus Jingweiarchaeum tengchongense]